MTSWSRVLFIASTSGCWGLSHKYVSLVMVILVYSPQPNRERNSG